MKDVLVDSNVILDIFLNDPNWADWSEAILGEYSTSSTLCINSIIYSEISIGFKRIEELEFAIDRGGFQIREIPREALFLEGKSFVKYRRVKGFKRSPLPDFYIGAHAAVLKMSLITRDTARYSTYFPTVKLISPN